MRLLIACVVIVLAAQALAREQGVLQAQNEIEVAPQGELVVEFPAINFDNHHTNKYLSAKPTFFVLRRGAGAEINLCFAKAVDANQFDVTKIKASFVDAADSANVVDVAAAGKSTGFVGACPAKSALTITLPGNMAWGKYSLEFILTDKSAKTFKVLFATPIYVIFNAYSNKDADVYLGDSAQIDEYVQNTIAYIWHSSEQAQHYTFDLGQHSILPIVYEWATMKSRTTQCTDPRTSVITTEERKSAYKTLKFFAPLFQTSDQHGDSATFEQQRTDAGCHGYLLIGRWGLSEPEQPADYGTNPASRVKYDKELKEFENTQNHWYWQVDGKEKTLATMPWRWRNIADIFNLWKKQGGMPVRFAQCFIYSSVTTATGRSLGIPIRPVSTIDRSCHPSHKEPWAIANKNKGDKVQHWNFHVWTDAFVSNPINKNVPQWNAFDGNTVNGPIPLEFIRNNVDPAGLKSGATSKDKSDLKEFIGETKELFWKSATPYAAGAVDLTKPEERRAKHNDGTLNLQQCGKFIFSKKVGCSDTAMGVPKSCADANEMLNYKAAKSATFFAKPDEIYLEESEEIVDPTIKKEKQNEKKVKAPKSPLVKKTSAKKVKPQIKTPQTKADDKKKTPTKPSNQKPQETKSLTGTKRPFKVRFTPEAPKVGEAVTFNIVKQIEKAQLQIHGPVRVEVTLNDYTNRIKFTVLKKTIPAASLNNEITKVTETVNADQYVSFLRVREVRYLVVRVFVPIRNRELLLRGAVELRLPTVTVAFLSKEGKNPVLENKPKAGLGGLLGRIQTAAKNTMGNIAKFFKWTFDKLGQPELKAEQTFDVEASFVNPLKIPLTEGTLVVRNGDRKHKFQIPKVAPGAMHRQVVKNIKAGEKNNGGAPTQLMYARFDFKELHDFTGVTSWVVTDKSARQDVRLVSKLVPVTKK